MGERDADQGHRRGAGRNPLRRNQQGPANGPHAAREPSGKAARMRLTLPWPDKRLSPNARLHWRAKAQVIKRARWNASYAVLEAANGTLSETRKAVADLRLIPIVVRFYPPDARHRDDDNMVGSFKAMRDGIADALGVNDRRFRPHYIFADPEAPGRVEVELG